MSEISIIAVLDDPVRRSLYDYVSARGDGVSRSEAAAATGIGRTLAAFHLDRLAEAGLVEVTFARPSGRTGPGAGRPAKLYRRAVREFSVTLPQRSYELAGRHMARGIAGARGAGRPVAETLAEAAREQGQGIAAEALRRAGEGPSEAALLAATRSVLDEQGYATRAEPAGLAFANCPFHLLAGRHPPLICGMNLALLEGLLAGAGVSGLTARLDPRPGECCVVLEKSKNNHD